MANEFVPVPALPSRFWQTTEARLWQTTAARLAGEQRVWTGRSRRLSGAAVAGYLIDIDGWLASGGGWDARRRPLQVAVIKAAPGGLDDLNSQMVVRRLLGVILQARANANQPVDVDAWEAQPGRTWREVDQLIEDGVRFAREHGPRGGR